MGRRCCLKPVLITIHPDQPLPKMIHILQATAHTASSFQYPSSWMIRLHHFRVPSERPERFLPPLDAPKDVIGFIFIVPGPITPMGWNQPRKTTFVLAVPTHRIQLKPIAPQSTIMKGLADIGSCGMTSQNSGTRCSSCSGYRPCLR